jgi:hypothetical protein
MPDVAGSRLITRKTADFRPFALCRRLPPFAALRIGGTAKEQKKGGSPTQMANFGEAQAAGAARLQLRVNGAKFKVRSP